MTADNLITPAELAERLRVSVAHLANWRYRGVGPKFVKMGKLVRYQESAVEEWLQDNTHQQTEEA